MSTRKWNNKDALKFYIETNFSKKETAKKLNISHVNFHMTIKRDEILRNALKEAEEIRLDMAEDALNNLVHREDIRAVRYLLDRKGRDRGYGEKVEIMSDENNRKFSSVKITDEGKTIVLN